MKEVNVGKLVRKVLYNRRIKVYSFAEQIRVRPTTACRMLKQSNVSVDKLISISKVLNYNFFREIEELLEINEPVNAGFEEYKAQTNVKIQGLEAKIAELEKALASAEKENALLLKVVDAMTTKKKG